MLRPLYLFPSLVLALTTLPAPAQPQPATPTPSSEQVKRWYGDYMHALNSHDIESTMRFYSPNLVRRRKGQVVASTSDGFRNIREWEAATSTQFGFEVLSVHGEWLTARVDETNSLYSALEVRRPQVSEYRFQKGVIVEMNTKEIRDEGRVWPHALAEFEAWLSNQPVAETSGVIADGHLAFTGEGGRKLLPFLEQWKQLTAVARAANVKVMESFMQAMNRHDVDAQYRHYAPGMFYLDGDRRVPPHKEEERPEREFEAVNDAVWRYQVLGAGLDSLELIISEDMEFYRLLGVGPRSHHARYRFRDGRILQIQTWDWTEAGLPYGATLQEFTAWVRRERPQAAVEITRNGELIFTRETARLINPLVREWRTVSGQCARH